MSNPIITFYDALWSALEDSDKFLALFPQGNRRRHRSHDAAEKEIKSEADYPQIVITPSQGGWRPPQVESSSYLRMDHQITIDVMTGNHGIDIVSEIQWVIFHQILSKRPDLMDVKWQNNDIIEYVSLIDNTPDLNEEQARRGWANILMLEVRFGLSKELF